MKWRSRYYSKNVSYALEYLLNSWQGKRCPPVIFTSEAVARKSLIAHLQLLLHYKLTPQLSKNDARQIAEAWLEKIASEKDMRWICPPWKGTLPASNKYNEQNICSKIRLEYQEKTSRYADLKLPYYRIVFPDGHCSDWNGVTEKMYHEYQGKWYFAFPVNWPEPFKNRVFELKDVDAEILNAELISDIV